MSDPKHRSPPPRAHGSTPPLSSASQRHAVPNSHASSKGNDASQRLKKPQQVDEKQSGRVAFDAKGNPVWEWQTSTGVFEQNVSTQRLKKLEAPELSLAATQPIPTLGGNSKGNTSNKAASNFAGKSPTTTKSKEDTGFNPYDSDAPVRPRTDRTAASHPALVHKRPPNGKGRDAVSKPQGTWDKFKSKFS